jgi:DnaJ family protein C protein 9
VDSDGFSWSDFYSEQFKDAISVDAIEKFAQTYKASDEEKDDLLAAYEEAQGKMDTVYQVVMLSDPREDETRFREIIDTAIEGGDVKSYRAYTHETKRQREKRIKEYDEEGAEAMEYAEQLGVADKLFNRDKKPSGEDALKALIQKRQQGRGSFLDQLEAKYASKSASKPKSKKGSKMSLQNDLDEEAEDGVNDEAALEDEPSEEAFQAAAARLKKNAPAKATRDDKANNRSKRVKTKR